MTHHTFPKSALTSERVELDDEELVVVDGQVPEDLRGRVYSVAAVGDVTHASPDSRGDGTAFLNGDGFVYRLTFSGAARAPRLAARPVATPCYVADRQTRHVQKSWSFENFGIARISFPYLGGRNFANTALLPVPVADKTYRLLACYDAGRPFEVDPVTLDTLGPIGLSGDWEPTFMGSLPFPFVGASAHPVYDRATRELFTINFVRDARTIIERTFQNLDPRRLKDDKGLDEPIDEWIDRNKSLFDDVWEALERIRRSLEVVSREGKQVGKTSLLRWTPDDTVRRWELVLEDGRPFEILHSSHQVGLTKSHVILVDTAFKFEADQIMSMAGVPNRVRAALRALLSKRQPRRTRLVLVPRAQLASSGPITVRLVEVDAEIVHFSTNYEPHDGKIVMHVVDQISSDAAEFLGPDDVQKVSRGKIPREAWGGLAAAMDVNAFGAILIDPATGAVTRPTPLERNEAHMFGIGLSAGVDFPMAPGGATVRRGLGDASTVGSLEQAVFFYAHGLIPSLLSDLIYRLYRAEHARQRKTPQEMLALAASGGTPASICRFDTATGKVVDAHFMDAGTIVISPQLVPGEEGRAYLVCNVFSDTTKAIWIFDASALARGPICKIERRDRPLPWPYTLHTCWLPLELVRPAPRPIDHEKDFAHVKDPVTLQFLRDHVFPGLYARTEPAPEPTPETNE